MMTVTKHHGLGNDFLVLFDPPDVDLADLARRWCDRRRGVGADGLLVGTASPDHDARMILHNADGSRAEMSGNGIRCFAQAISRRQGRTGDLRIITDAGERAVSVSATDRVDTVQVSVDMGAVERLGPPVGWETLGCQPGRPVAHLGLGNPHAVVGVDDVGVVDLADLGARVPSVNLEIVEPGDQPHLVRMRVHERGVGITEACGTGACATAFAAASWGLATPRDGEIVVVMDGGSAIVGLDRPAIGHVTLTGPATFVATLEIDLVP